MLKRKEFLENLSLNQKVFLTVLISVLLVYSAVALTLFLYIKHVIKNNRINDLKKQNYFIDIFLLVKKFEKFFFYV